nr:Chain A, PawL-Derived Peptide PLP-38 [Rudbeckia hirta]
GLYPYPD